MVEHLKRYSYSSLATYDSCPRKFKFEKVDKVKRESRGNASAVMGSVVHSILEKLYKLGFDNVLMPQDDMITEYKKLWNNHAIDLIEVSSEYQTVDDYIKIGEDILVKYYEKFQPFNQNTLLGTEQSLSFELPGTDFSFNCRIDKITKRPDGVIEITDYKTGNYLAKPKDKGYHFQMGLYLLAVRANYPQFKEIELVQYFLRHGEEVKYKMREDEEENLVEEFRNSIYEIIDSFNNDNFPIKESSFCRFCDYTKICPAKVHSKLLEDEEKSDIGELSPEKLKALADEYITKKKESDILKEEVETLKLNLIEISKQADISIFESDFGKVNVSVKNEQKFVGKSKDKKRYSELNFICREAGFEDYFVLDSNTFMKEIVKKGRLEPELLQKIEPYIDSIVQARVTIKKKITKDPDEPLIIE